MLHDPAGHAGKGRERLTPEEFAARFQESASVLWTIAAAVFGERSQAEDILQEACVIALGKLEQFDPRTSFAAWMGAMVRNVARNAARKGRRRATAPVDPSSLGELEIEGTAAPVLAGLDERGELAGDTGAFDDALAAALAALRPTARAALLLRTVQDLEYREIAAVLAIPEGTAMSHVHRSRQELRRRLLAEVAPLGEPGEVPEEAKARSRELWRRV